MIDVLGSLQTVKRTAVISTLVGATRLVQHDELRSGDLCKYECPKGSCLDLQWTRRGDEEGVVVEF